MARKPQTAIGIELGARLVTLVAYDIAHRQIQLVAMENAPAGWQKDVTQLGVMLKDWLLSLGLDKKTSVTSACVSAHAAALRLVELDPEENAEEALREELAAWSSIGPDRFYLNGLPMSKGPNGLPAMLMAALPSAFAGSIRDAFATTDFALSELGLDAVALVNSFGKCQPSWQDHVAALIKIDAPLAQVTWVREGEFAGYAMAGATGSGDPLEPLTAEIQRILNDGEGLCGAQAADCRAVFLCGEQGGDGGIASRLGSQLRADVQPLDAFSHTPFPSLEANTQQITEIAPQCAAALGMALALAEGAAR